MTNSNHLSTSSGRHCASLFYVDARGRIAYVNEYCCRYLGYGRGELIAHAVMDLDMMMDRDMFMNMLRQRMCGQPARFETAIRHKDGMTSQVEINITHAPYGGGMLLKCELRDTDSCDRQVRHDSSKNLTGACGALAC